MKALIAADRDVDRTLLRYYLEQHGAEVVEAADGAQGLELALEHHPDLIISEIQMPKVDGFQFLREVRNAPELLGTLFIFYSAVYTVSRDRELAESLCADAFIVKPKAQAAFWADLQAALKAVRKKKRQQCEILLREEDAFLQKYSAVVAERVGAQVETLEKTDQSLPLPSSISFSELNDLPEVPESIPGIDVGYGLKHLLGKRKLYGKVLYAFERDNQTTKQQLQQVFSERDFKSLAEVVHRIKGTAGLVGATRLDELTIELGRQLKQGQEDVGDLLTQLCDELQLVLQSIRQIFKGD